MTRVLTHSLFPVVLLTLIVVIFMQLIKSLKQGFNESNFKLFGNLLLDLFRHLFIRNRKNLILYTRFNKNTSSKFSQVGLF